MDTTVWIILAVAVLVVVVVGLVLARRSRRGAGEVGPGDAQTGGEIPAFPPSTGEPADPGAIDGVVITHPHGAIQKPENVASRLVRLRARLARSGALGQALLAVLGRDHLDEAAWEELEETLLQADLGIDPTTRILTELRTRIRVDGTKDPAQVRSILRELLLAEVDPTMDRTLHTQRHVLGGSAEDPDSVVYFPATFLMVGVNGTGKTTTAGKLARLLVAEDKTVLLGAADTFRAAAADQLQTWGERVGVDVVRSDREGADPASVAHDAVLRGARDGVDVVIVDTAGRLQNKSGLMDELGKITRVVTKRAPVAESLLVLDATTGQNGLRQARVFAEVAQLTGIVLTKLDGSAKGGIVVAVQRELGIPVKLVGLGEGPDDLAPFDPETFVDALLG
ncbi:signal recognition particle-docking protein FtsY [Salana multivorans]|uniref:Signal recognition particle receptor FtsY n=1 Tax=Salana multivorans TaxID=120377 RepID=A0A3N2D2G4_9MICO|nr:signal recognition particle-docking protein FtsY [Salana multivorans]MBN8880875.1 signal recognition particle-docking protein FtsY [Salana multivorans]OJX95686.1 MAG: signal recognition particle-docking protein FtsY [Micrococcales bacterium 73-15]ROR93949.1 signal recognition particle-docking protein FtsY [Salana multivorans]